MNAFVTGAAGFAGQHLTRLLIEKGVRVFGAYLPSRPEDAQIIRNLQAEAVPCDITDRAGVFSSLNDLRPRRIYHLAAQASVRSSEEKVEITWQVNFFGSTNILRAAVDLGFPCRILYVGSGAVYGKVPEEELPADEDRPMQPVDNYSASKAAADEACRQFFEVEGLHTVRVRPFNHTGPGQAESFVASDFARQIVLRERGLVEPVISVGDISVRRDFSDVRDVVRAYYQLLEDGKAGEVYNVGSGRVVSIKELLETLLKSSERSINVKVDGTRFRKSEIPILSGSCEKMKEIVDWENLIPLENTLSDLLHYWRNKIPKE